MHCKLLLFYLNEDFAWILEEAIHFCFFIFLLAGCNKIKWRSATLQKTRRSNKIIDVITVRLFIDYFKRKRELSFKVGTVRGLSY